MSTGPTRPGPGVAPPSASVWAWEQAMTSEAMPRRVSAASWSDPGPVLKAVSD